MDNRIMIGASILAGLLSTMNVYAVKPSDIRFHLNDLYMILLMTAWMSLFIELSMYPHINKMSVLLSLTGVVIVLILIKKQYFITDSQFMKGMIPHHSMALRMAEKIKEKSKNEAIISLANNIISSQSDEINYMKRLGY